jgi:hypothetical protein
VLLLMKDRVRYWEVLGRYDFSYKSYISTISKSLWRMIGCARAVKPSNQHFEAATEAGATIRVSALIVASFNEAHSSGPRSVPRPCAGSYK